MWTSSMTDPFSFAEPSTLCTRTGWGRGVVSSWCFCTKLWFMNMPVALESRSVDVETDTREVREVSSTWMLREQGETLQRDIDCRWGNCCKGFGKVAHMGSLNFSGCGFSLVTLGYGRSSWITMVYTIRSIHSGQPGCMPHRLQL